MFFEAAVTNNRAALELLLREGAEWPSSFIGRQWVLSNRVRVCWDSRAVAWALSKDCGWLEWRCQDLASELYCEYSRQLAVGLFAWAHENGCPCTCEAVAADE
jgi:hypothetical protein